MVGVVGVAGAVMEVEMVGARLVERWGECVFVRGRREEAGEGPTEGEEVEAATFLER